MAPQMDGAMTNTMMARVWLIDGSSLRSIETFADLVVQPACRRRRRGDRTS
jgi:hypothetical protein